MVFLKLQSNQRQLLMKLSLERIGYLGILCLEVKCEKKKFRVIKSKWINGFNSSAPRPARLSKSGEGEEAYADGGSSVPRRVGTGEPITVSPEGPTFLPRRLLTAREPVVALCPPPRTRSHTVKVSLTLSVSFKLNLSCAHACVPACVRACVRACTCMRAFVLICIKTPEIDPPMKNVLTSFNE